MYKACKTALSAQRQRHIVDSMVEMLQSRRFSEVTIQSLCQKAGLPRKTFYRYFDSKEDVIDAMIDFATTDYESFCGPYLEGEPRTSEKDVEKLFLFWLQHKNILDALRRSGMSGRLIGRSMHLSYLEKVGYRLVNQGEEAGPDVFRMTTYFSICGLYVLILDWHHRGCRETPQEMARATYKLLTHPLYCSL